MEPELLVHTLEKKEVSNLPVFLSCTAVQEVSPSKRKALVAPDLRIHKYLRVKLIHNELHMIS